MNCCEIGLVHLCVLVLGGWQMFLVCDLVFSAPDVHLVHWFASVYLSSVFCSVHCQF